MRDNFIPRGQVVNVSCRANTGPVSSTIPVLFDEMYQWPTDLQIYETLKTVKKPSVSRIAIEVHNTTLGERELWIEPEWRRCEPHLNLSIRQPNATPGFQSLPVRICILSSYPQVPMTEISSTRLDGYLDYSSARHARSSVRSTLAPFQRTADF